MIQVIRQLPFFETPISVTVGGVAVPIKPYQVVLWVSIAPMGRRHLDPGVLRFPAVLDTGFNHSFILQQQHLVQWAGLQPDELVPLARIQVYGEEAPLVSGNVWLHRNKPGRRDEFARLPPFCLELDRSVAIPSGRSHAPRRPLLGLRALRGGSLDVQSDGANRQVSIRAPQPPR